MTRNIPLSPASVSIISTWYGYDDGHGNIRYITPTVDGRWITLSLPAELEGASFESAHLSYTRTGASGTVKLTYQNSGVIVTDANLLAKLAAGETEIVMYCSFRATGGTGGEGVHTAAGGLSNMALTVDYVPAAPVVGTITAGGKTLTYTCPVASLAPDETAVLTLSTDASATEGTINIGGKEYAVTFTEGRADVEITVDAEDLTTRLTAAELSADITYGETEVSFPETETALTLVKTRLPPVITVTVSDATDVYDEFGAFVAGQSQPVIHASVTADTSADSGIAVVSRTLTVDGVAYSLASGEAVLDALAAGNHTWVVTATDSFGKSSTSTGSFTILSYAPPAVSTLEVQRCAVTYDSEGHEIVTADDGSPNVWLTLNMTVSSVADMNAWSADLILAGEDDTITLTGILSGDDGEHVVLNRNTELLSDVELNVTKSYTVTLVVRDAFTEKSFSCADIPAAGGILNIERYGVAVGKRSEGTAAKPLFEVAWPAVFRGETAFPGEDSGWIVLNTSGITAGGLSVRKRLGEVFLTGSFRLNTALSSGLTGAAAGKLNVASLPAGWVGREMVFPLILDKSSGCIRLHITQEGAVYLENRSGYGLSSNLDIIVNVNWLI